MRYWIFDDPPWLPGYVMRLRRVQNQKRVDQVEIREGLKSYFSAEPEREGLGNMPTDKKVEPTWNLDNYEDDPEYDPDEWYVDEKGSLWTYSAGQEGDVCVCCEGDISEHYSIFINQDFAYWRLLCRKCAGFIY